MIIAIDGPAASGKGTLAKRLAAHFGFHHLDTGLLYRGTAFALVDAGKSLDDEILASEAASSLNLDQLDEEVLSAHEVGEAASKVAAMPAVRTALFSAQQDFSKRQPGAVLDGRDIGTVICPAAEVKLYVTATPEVRSMRRYQQAQMRGSEITYMEVLEDIRKRDERDAGRDSAPLKIADDASLIDTSEMSIEAAFGHALQIAEERIGK